MQRDYIDVNELKKLQLDILMQVQDFCTEHHLKYSLAYGTLLGAIRHNGYIPWDDDIDIMLPRQDYEKFIHTFLTENYKVVHVDNDKAYTLPFAKVFDSRTTMREFVDSTNNFGVFIDVFPIDNVPDSILKESILLKCKQALNLVHNIKNVRIAKKRGCIKNVILFFGKLIFSPFSMHRCAKFMNALSRYYENSETKRQSIITPANNSKKWINTKDVFQGYELISFEGKNVSIISEYDKFLSSVYGDYMKLPPKEKRVSHHNFEAWWN